MKTRLLQVTSWLQASFWFLPGLLVLVCAALALGLIAIDERVTADWITKLPWIFSGGADGARGLLSAIASSIVTVTGVTFSITVVALTLAAQQYTPRLLREFTADRGNQLVLGTFLGTFIYSLLVLRTIRAEQFGDFVPHLAVTGAVALAIWSVALLIFFIHHVTLSLRPNSILAAITEQAQGLIDHLFPERLGASGLEVDAPVAGDPGGPGERVRARKSGYVQTVDSQRLLRIAEEHQLLLRMDVGVGEFVAANGPLLTVWPASAIKTEIEARLCGCFGVGPERTVQQDLEFAVLQIVDIAVKALSPGINDPTTAKNCLDYLGALLQQLGCREIPSRFRRGADGALRVIARGPDFEGVTCLALDEIRHYAEGTPGVTLHLIRTLARIAQALPQPERHRILRWQTDAVAESVEAAIPRSADLQLLREALQDARSHLLTGTLQLPGSREAPRSTFEPSR